MLVIKDKIFEINDIKEFSQMMKRITVCNKLGKICEKIYFRLKSKGFK